MPSLLVFSRSRWDQRASWNIIFILAHDLGFLNDSVYDELAKEITEVKRKLTSFLQKLKADS